MSKIVHPYWYQKKEKEQEQQIPIYIEPPSLEPIPYWPVKKEKHGPIEIDIAGDDNPFEV